MKKINIRVIMSSIFMAIVMCGIYSAMFFVLDYNNREIAREYMADAEVFIWFKPIHIIISFVANLLVFGLIFYFYSNLSTRAIHSRSFDYDLSDPRKLLKHSSSKTRKTLKSVSSSSRPVIKIRSYKKK